MKKIISLTSIISLLLLGGYVFFEPEITEALTATTAISLTVTGEINLNCSTTAALSPNIPGQTGGTATGTFGCVVTTSNASGYNMNIKKDQKLMIADFADQRFDDYVTTTGSTADFNFATIAAGAEQFGFAVNYCASTTDIVVAYRDNGVICGGAGASTTAWKCWTAIPTNPSTTSIANRATATPVGGILTVFGLEAQAGGTNNLNSGNYTCTTTVTAVTNP